MYTWLTVANRYGSHVHSILCTGGKLTSRSLLVKARASLRGNSQTEETKSFQREQFQMCLRIIGGFCVVVLKFI